MLSILLLAIGLTGLPDMEQQPGEPPPVVSEMDGVQGIDAWMRETAGQDAFVFIEIRNMSDADVTILGGKAEVAEAIELVEISLEDGFARYEPVPELAVEAGRGLAFTPSGPAFRLAGMHRPLYQGEEFVMRIALDTGYLDVPVAVELANAMQHSHGNPEY